jgi:hypothetical protein
MKRAAGIALFAYLACWFMGCVAYPTYNNLEVISPKPNFHSGQRKYRWFGKFLNKKCQQKCQHASSVGSKMELKKVG